MRVEAGEILTSIYLCDVKQTTSEPQLIEALKRGDTKAFGSIYAMYAKRLYGYCLSLTKSPEDTEEIVQDVFVRLWNGRGSIRQEDTLRSLLFIMAKRQVLNALRSRVAHPAYEEYVNYLATAATASDTSHKVEYHDFLARFRHALATLSATQQSVVRLSKIEQKTNRDIAAELGLSEQTVKNQLSLGLKTLRALLRIALLLMLPNIFSR